MQSTASALFYLRATSIRNAVVARIKRLRQPKYLLGGIVGAAYFYFALFLQFRLGANANPNPSAPPSHIVDLYHSAPMIIGALAFTVFTLLYWIWPRARAALTFAEAEIAFLFPAPISRRTLIHYRIVNLMLGLLLTSFLFSLFSSSSTSLSSHAVMRFMGWWLLLLILALHSIASSFVITRLLDRGLTSVRRQLIVFVAMIIIVLVLVKWTQHSMLVAQAPDIVDAESLKGYVLQLLDTAPLSWLLLPAKLVIAPVFAASGSTFVLALIPACLIAAIHYVWVLKSEIAFEEASLIKAEKRAAKVTAMRSGKVQLGQSQPKARKQPFNLNNAWRPEIAFLWKNLLATAPYLRWRTAWLATVIVVVGSGWITNGEHEVVRSVVLGVVSILSGYVLFFGPIVARQDLRSDLPNIDILKSFPLRGWQIVLGEVLTPVIIVSGMFWLLLLTSSLCTHAEQIRWMTPVIHWTATLALAIIGMLLCAAQVLLLNAATLMFPAWVQTGQSVGPAGIEAMGQRLLFMAGLMLIVIFSLLPAALFAALMFFLTKWFAGYLIATALATITVIAILIVEIIFGIEWLGKKFEAFDLSAELRK